MSKAVIELRDVVRRYPGDPPVESLREVTLRVEPGELLAVMGPSGSGKSTLLHLMGTLERPTSGRVRVTGLDVSELSDRELATVRATRIAHAKRTTSPPAPDRQRSSRDVTWRRSGGSAECA